MKQVEKHGIVVWYDPQKHYSEFVRDLKLGDVPVEIYSDSFFELRRRIEGFLAGPQPPRLVVYVPMDRSETHDALVEVEAAGALMYPGAQPRERNTRLTVVARAALRDVVSESELRSIEKQIEANQLKLQDLDRIGGGGSAGILGIIFETESKQEIALRFISTDKHDDELVSRNATPELASLLRSEFDLQVQNGSPSDLRDRFARHVLITEFLTALHGEIPQQLSSQRVTSDPAVRQACAALAGAWRRRLDLRESYIAASRKVSQALGLPQIAFTLDQIRDVETFPDLEEHLQGLVESALASDPGEDLLDIARDHRSLWEDQPEIQARWNLIENAGRLLLEAERVENELRSCEESATLLFRRYTSGDRPWMQLDSLYRSMEKRYHDLNDIEDSLERLIVKARQRYTDTVSEMVERFIRALQRDNFRIDGAVRQLEVFDRYVRPYIPEQRTAYVLADALRYEMAVDLMQSLSSYFDADAPRQPVPAIASVPTVTKIGMASLLPGAAGGEIVAEDGELGFMIGERVLRSREDRLSFISEMLPSNVRVFACDLDSLLPTPGKGVEAEIKRADLIVITSTEIDSLCESDNLSLARTFMNDLLSRLQKAIRNLAKLGVSRVVVSSDHGFLLVEEIGADMSIEPPGGETIELHRRVWVGRGGASDPAYLRASLSDLGLRGALEIATPCSLACFVAKGRSRAYLHGGLSLQELVIPVLVLKPRDLRQTGEKISWSIDLRSKKLTTSYFSVNLSASSKPTVLCIEPRRIRLEIRDGNECISRTVSASYGLDETTGEVEMVPSDKETWRMRDNTVTLHVVRYPKDKFVSLHILDALTDVELVEPMRIEVSMLQY
ncbi:MAG: PglZ domain-containing protein [Methanothrix sp.]